MLFKIFITNLLNGLVLYEVLPDFLWDYIVGRSKQGDGSCEAGRCMWITTKDSLKPR